MVGGSPSWLIHSLHRAPWGIFDELREEHKISVVTLAQGVHFVLCRAFKKEPVGQIPLGVIPFQKNDLFWWLEVRLYIDLGR